jgi:WNK lysine deficient protein kinase
MDNPNNPHSSQPAASGSASKERHDSVDQESKYQDTHDDDYQGEDENEEAENDSEEEQNKVPESKFKPQKKKEKPVPKEEDKAGSDEDDSDEESSPEDEEEEEEVDQTEEDSYSIVEVSPKGRFKRFNEELGRGAYKSVFRGIDEDTGREIAWNVIKIKKLPKIERRRISEEINTLKSMKEHPNIIHFISAWINKQKEEVVFITEMVTAGSIRQYLKRIKKPRLKVLKTWAIQILKGLQYLHELNPPIIHRDIKCDNIFINSHKGEIRIGDLGLSTSLSHSYTTSVLGTPEFMAPELYEEKYGTSVDIYAFGMCFLEMCTMSTPYKECDNPAQIYKKVIEGVKPQALERIEDQDVVEFISMCLETKERRPTARDLLECDFLKDLDSEHTNNPVRLKAK